jgi:sulfide dehydrogenase [flavocytochrome c] flavoprotein subunit
MKKLNNYRRSFLKSSGYLLSTLLFSSLFKINSSVAKTKLKPKIIIVGFGIGGATCLSYLLKFSKNFDIIVIEKNEKIQTCPMSNLVIADIIPYSYISHDYDLKKLKNIKFLKSSVKKINTFKKNLETEDSLKINYDYLILSPGINFKNDIVGYNSEDRNIVPHCWNGTKDIFKFKKGLNDLGKKSTIIISAPDYPYRCPPAPYERASLLANFLYRKKKKFKIIILDSKDSFTKKEIFLNEWRNYHKGSIEWVSKSSGGKVVYFNKKENYVKTSDGSKFKADFINIIPNQKAAAIITKSELNVDKDWCDVNPMTFELKNFKDIFVIGDSIDAGDMPKSAFSANSQAKILATNLVNRIYEKDFLNPVFLNTCYSFSSSQRAFSITSWYKLNNKKTKIISLGSSTTKVDALSHQYYDETRQAYGWYENLVKTIYG